ncbi:MAG: hypothetical protein HYS05_20095 [Acidobacteria bacterium]|nr:hypothetical protein [Acidobacteriota bacterium]
MKRKVYPRPPTLCPDRSSPSANEFREEVFFAGVRASRLDGAPLEADHSRDVEGLGAPRWGSPDRGLPTPHGVGEIDRLGTPIGVMEEEPRLLKNIFESVTELSVAHVLPPERFDTVACALVSPPATAR